MSLHQQDILQLEQMFEKTLNRLLEAKLQPIYTKIESLTTDTKQNELIALQRQLLKKEVLTISEICKSQLIGEFSKQSIREKLKEYSFMDGNKMKVPTSVIIMLKDNL